MLSRSTPEGARDFLVPCAPRARDLLRAAAVAAAVQAAADGRRLRALLPDRALLSRRGPARRPPARLHPARHRDVVRRASRTSSTSTSGCWRRCSARRRPADRAAAAPDVPTTRRSPATAPTAPTCASGSSSRRSPICSSETEFKVFRGVIEAGGVVKGLNAGARDVPRSALDGLIGRAQELGAKGLVWAFREGDGWRSPTAKFLSDAELAALNERLGAEEGDLLLVVADRARRRERGARPAAPRPWRAVRADRPERGGVLLDRRVADVRLERGRAALGSAAPPVHRARPASSTSTTRAPPGRSPTTSSGTARSSAAARSVSPTPSSSSGRWRRSGSGREEAQERFGFLLEALRYGAPPHGGIAYGLDRWVQRLVHADSIRDVIAFPKAASGADPLTGAPAPVDEDQLRELGLSVRAKRPG